MNVGELLKERDRLLGVIQEARRAKVRITQLNKLIALYGDESNVTLLPEKTLFGRSQTAEAQRSRAYRSAKGRPGRYQNVKCSKCGESYRGAQGFGAHNRAAHGGKAKPVYGKAKAS